MLFILIIILICSCYYLKLDFSSPLVLHLSPWIIVLASKLYFGSSYFEICDEAYFILSIWIFIVYFALLFFLSPDFKKNNDKIEYVGLPYNYSLVLILIVFLALLKVRSVAMNGLGDIAYNLRSASISQDNNNLGWVLRIQPLMLVLLYREYMRPKIEWVKFGLCSVFAILIIVGTMSKFAIIGQGLGLIILRIRKHGISLIKIIIIALILLLLLIVLQFARSNNDFDNNILSLLSIYIYSPLVAFSNAIQTNNVYSDYFGMNVFQFFYKVFSFILGPVPSPAVASSLYGFWSFVPYSTNVYTILFPIYVDFKYYGIVIFGIFYGVVFGFLYKKSYKSLPILIIYAYMVQSLFMQIFDETLFRTLSGYLQIIFWAFFLEKLSNSTRISFKIF